MVKKDKAVSDAGPLIHLNQITLSNRFLAFFDVYIPQEVYSEIKRHGDLKVKKLDMKSKYKDLARMLAEKYLLGLGESEATRHVRDSNKTVSQRFNIKRICKEKNS